MIREMLKSKIHRVAVTQTELDYMGSITIDSELVRSADIYEGEKVQVVNLNTGARFETYVIYGKSGSGVIGLNGAAARLGEIGDKLIIISYAYYKEEELDNYKPKVISVDNINKKIQ